MFKYKTSPTVLGILLALSVIFFFIYFKISEIEIEKDDKLLKNNIVFSGIITNLNVSKNHAFGIMQLKILETNNHSFTQYQKNKIFPYAIKDSTAEIYTHIAIPEIKNGYKVFLNSNDKSITIYDDNKFLYKWNASMVSEDSDKQFVNENSIFK